MSTYDDASLIYYPSGYKESKAYSLKPTDGSGDLTFTRASTATRVNEQGLIEGVRTNLVLYSQQFENAYWTKTGSTVTSGFSSPLAAYPTSGYKLGASNTISTPKYINSSIITVGGGTATIVTSQFFIKKGEKTKVGISDGHYNQGWVAVNLTDGSIISTGGVGYISNSVQLFVDDWYLISLTFTTHSSGTYKTTVSLLDDSYVSGNTKNYAYVGVVGEGAYIFGSQSELGASATEYIPTTTTAVSVGMLANVPRIDYTGGGCAKLLLEPQRTNSALWSEDYSQTSFWNSNSNVSIVKNYTSPTGSLNASKIIANTTNGHHSIRTTGLLSVQKYYYSLYVKAAEYSFFQIANQSTSDIVNFNLSNGTLLKSNASDIAYINDMGNGWWKCEVLFNTTYAGIYNVIVTSINSARLESFVGNNTDGLYIFGSQLEGSGATYPTSYIPTSGVAVTRTQDRATKSGISSLINSEEGVLYAEIAALANDGTYREISLNDGTINNVLEIRYTPTDNQFQFIIRNGGAAVVVESITLSNALDFNKIAFSYKSNDYKMYVNGVQVATDTSGAMPSGLNALSLEWGGNYFYGNVQSLMVFPTALSDDDLTLLTGTLGETYFESYALMANYLNYTIQ